GSSSSIRSSIDATIAENGRNQANQGSLISNFKNSFGVAIVPNELSYSIRSESISALCSTTSLSRSAPSTCRNSLSSDDRPSANLMNQARRDAIQAQRHIASAEGSVQPAGAPLFRFA